LVSELIPYARNSRTHSKAQVSQIAASIKEFGFTNPILIDEENMIIAGHGRVLAAEKLGLEHVPTIKLPHLNEIQKRAYILADNKLALNADWDEDLLKNELADLSIAEYDISVIGFSDKELKAFNIETDLENNLIEESVEEKKKEFLIVVTCVDEDEQKTIFESLVEQGIECKLI
jgi:ParB-like chromosome segregation protein Spo0J